MSSPFDIINALNKGKDVLKEDPNGLDEYNAFLTNRAFSYFVDTISYAQMMNQHWNLTPNQQYDFYLNIVRPRKRFSKWAKSESPEQLGLVMEFFGYSEKKARQALSVLSEDDITTIKTKLEKGGLNEKPD